MAASCRAYEASCRCLVVASLPVLLRDLSKRRRLPLRLLARSFARRSACLSRVTAARARHRTRVRCSPLEGRLLVVMVVQLAQEEAARCRYLHGGCSAMKVLARCRHRMQLLVAVAGAQLLASCDARRSPCSLKAAIGRESPCSLEVQVAPSSRV
ncbi:hypothetical protein Dimus_005085 [Dionaea muscipula]